METLFHLELTNLCTLKCPGCHRTQLINEGTKWKNHSVTLDDLKRFINIDISDKRFNLCGNYGDALYHPDLINIVKWIKGSGGAIQLTTNGSHKSKEFWDELSSLLDDRDEIIFSIDGMPYNFFKYRINADWDSVEVGIRSIAGTPALLSWKYIVFNYNENDIQKAEELAISLGVDNFTLHLSNRYTDEFNQEYMPSEQFVNKFDIESRTKVLNNNQTGFQSKCTGTSRSFNYFISAEGYFTPCCLLADKRFYFETEFYKNRDRYDIQTTTITEVLKSMEHFYKFENPGPGCNFFCGS